MIRREALGWLGAGTVGLMAGGATAEAAVEQDHRHDPAMTECLKDCTECAQTCQEMFRHCFGLTAEGKKEHAKASRMALDCAEFCGLSARLMGRHGELMAEACLACAEACKRCGDECARFDSPEMKACVESCRRCEKSCREMVKAMRGRS